MSPDDQPSEEEGVSTNFSRDGKLSYIQIPARNVAQSAAFYVRVFGWSDAGGDSPDHRSFSDAAGEMIGAWVTGRSIAAEPGVLPYIYVDGIDDTLARVEAEGGAIVRQPYPEGGLWVATFRDPAGNVIGVWHSGER